MKLGAASVSEEFASADCQGRSQRDTMQTAEILHFLAETHFEAAEILQSIDERHFGPAATLQSLAETHFGS
jgi:hypothetical protein